jgi:hypothetical protein
MKRAPIADHPIRRAERDQAIIDRNGDLKVLRREGGIVGWHAEPVAPAPERVRLNGARPAAAMIKQLEAACRQWADILRRSPFPAEYVRMKRSGQGAKWLETAADRALDWQPFEMVRGPDGILRKKHAKVRIPPAVPTAAELTWMDRMDDVLLTLGCQSFEYCLVTGRAQGVSWADLGARDVQRRGDRQLKRLHDEALVRLLPVWLTIL